MQPFVRRQPAQGLIGADQVQKEIGERVAAFERGASVTLPAEAVFAEARYVSQ
jgi:hypothetical protein